MDVLERLEKAKQSLERAISEYERGDKRLALGSIDYIEERAKAARYLLIAELQDEKVKE